MIPKWEQVSENTMLKQRVEAGKQFGWRGDCVAGDITALGVVLLFMAQGRFS
jgi:hypothetical protein